MAARGSAAKSASGAAMSKYDVEVESRLKALEAAVRELQTHEHAAPATSGGDGGRVDKLVEKLNQITTITDHCAKGADGVRRIDI